MRVLYRYRVHSAVLHRMSIALLVVVAPVCVVAIRFFHLPDSLEVDHLVVHSAFEIWLLGSGLAILGNMSERIPDAHY